MFFDSQPIMDGVPLVPLGTKVSIDQVKMPDGSMSVLLRILSGAGQFVFYLPPDGADEIGRGLQQFASASRAGMVVPDGTPPPPPPGSNGTGSRLVLP